MKMVVNYEDIFNHLPDAICIIDASSNKVKYINATFSSQLLSYNLIVGHTFESQVLKEDSREKYLKSIEESKWSSDDVIIGLCKSLSSIGKEKFPIYKNYFWVSRKINDDCIMLRGNVDVAKFSLPTESDYNYTEELLDFFQNAPIALHWLSGTGHVLWANNAELESLEYTKEEFIGHHIMEFCPDEEDSLNKVFDELCAGNTIRDAPFKFRTKSGKTKYLVVDSNVSWNTDGTFKHTRCFIRDDTQRRLNEVIKESEFKHMKALNSGKDSFIRRIFHDIKTPLHIMTDSLAEIEDAINNKRIPNLHDASSIKQNIDVILSTGEDIQYSVEFSEGRTIATKAVSFDVETSVHSMATYVETIERKSSQTVSFSYEFDKFLTSNDILVDSTINRVLFHLIRNAVRFSPTNSNIHIKVMGVDNGYYRFQITNNISKPIDLKAINHYFHNSYTVMNYSFEHLNNSLISEKGLGLGLYVSYNLVQAMGGLLECVANNDKSVTFQFNLNLQSIRKRSLSSPTRKKSIVCTGQLLRRRSYQMLENMCDTDVAKAHVIEDDEKDISNEMNISIHCTPNFMPSRRSSINLSTSVLGSVSGSLKDIPIVMPFTNMLDLEYNMPATMSGKRFQTLPPLSPTTSSKGQKSNQMRRISSFIEEKKLPSIPPHSNESMFVRQKSKLIDLHNNPSLPTSPSQHVTQALQCCNSNVPEINSRILVVDDSPLCQRVLVRLLNKHGYEVETANNGEEAVEKLSVEPCIYKACLMDLRMPIMDGITATRICREKPHLKTLRIVAITAEVGENIRKQVKEAGANYLIPKPALGSDIILALSAYSL